MAIRTLDLADMRRRAGVHGNLSGKEVLRLLDEIERLRNRIANIRAELNETVRLPLATDGDESWWLGFRRAYEGVRDELDELLASGQGQSGSDAERSD